MLLLLPLLFVIPAGNLLLLLLMLLPYSANGAATSQPKSLRRSAHRRDRSLRPDNFYSTTPASGSSAFVAIFISGYGVANTSGAL